MISGSFTEVGVSSGIIVFPKQAITYDLVVANAEAFNGTVRVERSLNGGQTHEVAQNVLGEPLTFTGEAQADTIGAGTIMNESPKLALYRVAVTDAGVGTDAVSFELAHVEGERVEVVLRDRNGVPLLYTTDDGGLAVAEGVDFVAGAVNGQTAGNKGNLDSAESVTTNGATATAVSLAVYQTNVSSGGSDGTENLALGDGTGAIVGQRKLITLVDRAGASDVVALDHANAVAADGTTGLDALALDAEGEFILVEWNGVAWQIIHANATVTETV